MEYIGEIIRNNETLTLDYAQNLDKRKVEENKNKNSLRWRPSFVSQISSPTRVLAMVSGHYADRKLAAPGG